MKFKQVLSVLISLISFCYITACDRDNQAESADNQQTGNPTEVRGIPVETMVVKSEDVQQSFSLSGMLKPKHSVDIVAEVSGKIIKITKQLGDVVNKKDILAVIDEKITLSNYKQAKSQVL